MTWLDEHPEVESVRCGAADLTGIARGKRLPRRFGEKLEKEGTRFPLSALNLDIWGEDVADSPLLFESGDPDGILKPTERGFVPMPWLNTPSALLPVWMFHEDGNPFGGDPRHALATVLARFSERDLTPVVATEMEFYLVDDSGDDICPPASPRSGRRRTGSNILSLRALDAYDDFLSELYAACDAMNIPAEAASSEAGNGQFEISIEHQPDAMKAADDAWLFKMLTHGLARKHGFAASFAAKPYPDWSGNGLHTHFSAIDTNGQNLMANDTFEGTPLLRQAIAGCLHGIQDLALIFAPHHTSYDRLVPNAHAPTGVCWAYENRTASVRVPGGSLKARRVEHRVAGGDVNPYLFIAAVLGSALIGIEDEMDPGTPLKGNAYDADLPQITGDWATAIDLFASSPIAQRIFDPQLIDNFVRTKRQEITQTAEMTDKELRDLYLDTV
ncbi:MAG: glutamine synthetase family protein [Pseudomonadota bacterium]